MRPGKCLHDYLHVRTCCPRTRREVYRVLECRKCGSVYLEPMLEPVYADEKGGEE